MGSGDCKARGRSSNERRIRGRRLAKRSGRRSTRSAEELKPLRLRSVAKREFREATAWYAERNEEIAKRFIAEVTRTFEPIEKYPMTGGPVPSISDPDIRRLRYTTFLITSCFCDYRIALQFWRSRTIGENPATGVEVRPPNSSRLCENLSA